MSIESAVDNEQIRTATRATCALCGDRGKFIHLAQPDRLFGAKGVWNFRQCARPECGLIWLDPMPLKGEISKAYLSYYTHGPGVRREPRGWRRLRGQITGPLKGAYLARKYGYPTTGPAPLGALSLLWYLFPLHRREVDADVRCLPAVTNGRLLDVGCGSGEWLLFMREKGWQVDGIDFDNEAVNAARRNGLPVKCGALEEEAYPDDWFDAVTLSHVIEHLPDPLSTLIECVRVLKPGGRLVILTPNGASLSHRFFRQHWRGLEPPRHLHIFSESSLYRAFALARLEHPVILPFIVTSVIYDSVLLQQNWRKPTLAISQKWAAWAFTRLFKLFEFLFLTFRASTADCLIAVVRKADAEHLRQ